MTTLADVNATLGATNIALAGVATNTEKTNEGLDNFLDYLRGKDATDRRKEIETNRETKPLLKSITGGAASVGGGLVSAGKSTFGFGKGLLGKLALPAGLLGGFLTSLLSSKLLRFGLPALGLLFGDQIAEMLTGPDAKKEVKDQVAGAIKGGALGLLFGPRFALIGTILGGLIKNDEVDKQAGELLTTLKDMKITLPSLSNIFKSINEGVADGLKGINQILKGNFSVDSAVDAIKLIGGAALLVSPAGSFFLLRSLARTRVGRILMAVAGLGLSTGVFGGNDKADTTNPAEMRGRELNTPKANDNKVFGVDVGGLSQYLTLDNLITAGTGAYLTKQLYNLGKGAFNLSKKLGLFGKASAAAEVATGTLSKSLANQNKTYRLFRNFQKGIMSGLGKFGMFMTRVGPLAIPLAAVGITEAIFGDEFRAENQANKIKQNALKSQGTVTAESKNFYGAAGGFVEDFQLTPGRKLKGAYGEGGGMNSMKLAEYFQLKQTPNYQDRIQGMAGSNDVNMLNSNNRTITTNNNAGVVLDNSGAIDRKDNLGNQIKNPSNLF